MAEIIDVLTTPFSEAAHFIVNTGAEYASVIGVEGTLGVWGIEGQQYLFQSRDNIRLLTAGYYIPESFTTADWYTRVDTANPLTSLRIRVYNKSDGLVADLPGYGSSSNGTLTIPFPNYEQALDLYCDMAGLAGRSIQIIDNFFKLKSILYCNNISMVGVPSALDGKVIKVFPFIKILHTKQLIDPARHPTLLIRDGNIATMVIASHGFPDGSVVTVSGAVQTEYNGPFVITVVDNDSFTYTVSGTPFSPATGPVVATIL